MITKSPILLTNQNLTYSSTNHNQQIPLQTQPQQILQNISITKTAFASPSNLCNRCSFHPSQIECLTCKTKLCQLCSLLLHNSSKFFVHEKKAVLIQQEQVQNNFIIRISEANQGMQNQAVKIMMEKMTIKQKWDKIQKQVERQFQAIMDLILEKQNHLIDSIDKKREEEIQYNLKHASSSRKRKSSISFLEQNLPKSQRGQNPTIRSFLFNEMKILVQKFELKNILNKPEEDKKPKSRRQTYITSNATTISSYSSVLGSPKNIKCKLPQFSFMDKLKKTFDRLNEQEMDQDPGFNQLKLMKAKSQKIIGKQKISENTFYDSKKK